MAPPTASQPRHLSLYRILVLPPVSPKARAIVALAAANMIWGGSPAASKVALDGIPPVTLGALRAGIALLILEYLLRRCGQIAPTGRGAAVLGLFGMALFCTFQNVGLAFADATTTALLNGAMPILIAVLAVPLLRDRISTVQIAGTAISFAGVLLIALPGAGSSPVASLGNLLPLGSVTAFSLFAVLSSRSLGSCNALAVVTGATRYGFLMMLPGAAVELAVQGLPRLTLQGALLIVYLGAGCSAAAFILNGYGYTQLRAGQAALYSNLKLLTGVTLGAALLREPLASAAIAGGTLVLLGVAVAGGSLRTVVDFGLNRRPWRPAQARS